MQKPFCLSWLAKRKFPELTAVFIGIFRSETFFDDDGTAEAIFSTLRDGLRMRFRKLLTRITLLAFDKGFLELSKFVGEAGLINWRFDWGGLSIIDYKE